MHWDNIVHADRQRYGSKHGFKSRALALRCAYLDIGMDTRHCTCTKALAQRLLRLHLKILTVLARTKHACLPWRTMHLVVPHFTLIAVAVLKSKSTLAMHFAHFKLACACKEHVSGVHDG